MSKQDNLTDFLTDVADAIREKKGTTDLINPQNFSEEIRGIESGENGLGYSGEVVDSHVVGIQNVKKVVIDEGITEVGTLAFYGYTQLKEVVLPSSITKIASQAFQSVNLKQINFPPSLTFIGGAAFMSMKYNGIVSLPNVSYIGSRAFEGAYGISGLELSDALTSIEANIFSGCSGIKGIIRMPAKIASIGSLAFNDVWQVSAFDFSRCTSIPILADTKCFNRGPKHIVPDALYDEWIAATNWSTYADRIVKASEFVEPTNNE